MATQVVMEVGDQKIETTLEEMEEVTGQLRNGESKPDELEPTPEDTRADLDDWAARICAQEVVVEKAEDRYLDLKEQTKDAKTEFEGAVNVLRRLVRDKDNPQRTLNFDAPAIEAPKEDWREVSVDTLCLPAGILKILGEAKLDTIGALADWSGANDGLSGIGGLGPAKQATVSNALDKFWKDHPEYCNPEPSEALEDEIEF